MADARAFSKGTRLTPLRAFVRKPFAPASINDVILLFAVTAMRRVIFETAAFRRVMGRGDYNAIRQTGFANAIVSEDCVRDDRSRRVVVSFREHDIDVICREDFESARQGWPGKCVRIDPEKQRTIDLLPLAVQTDCLRDGQNVPFIESPVEG